MEPSPCVNPISSTLLEKSHPTLSKPVFKLMSLNKGIQYGLEILLHFPGELRFHTFSPQNYQTFLIFNWWPSISVQHERGTPLSSTADLQPPLPDFYLMTWKKKKKKKRRSTSQRPSHLLPIFFSDFLPMWFSHFPSSIFLSLLNHSSPMQTYSYNFPL